MHKVTTWSPDTCGCVLHYEWDTDAPPETRTHTPVPGVTTHDGRALSHVKCPAHAHHPDHVTHYEAVLAENRKKNQALGLAAEYLAKTALQSMESWIDSLPPLAAKQWPPLVEELIAAAVHWSYDEKRTLRLHVAAEIVPHSAGLEQHLAAHGHSDVGVLRG